MLSVLLAFLLPGFDCAALLLRSIPNAVLDESSSLDETYDERLLTFVYGEELNYSLPMLGDSMEGDSQRSELVDLVASFKSTVEDMIVPYGDVAKKTEPKTCAIVASGGSLYNSRRGVEIDKHDLVFRLNAHPVRKWEADVGARTDIRLFYPESSSLLQPGGEFPDRAVMVSFKKADMAWLECVRGSKAIDTCLKCEEFWAPSVACRSLAKESNITTVSKKFYGIQSEFFKHVHTKRGPSLCFTAVTLALSFCSSLDLYGTSSSKSGRCHYHDNDKCPNYSGTNGQHDFSSEHAFYKRLSDAGLMRIT